MIYIFVIFILIIIIALLILGIPLYNKIGQSIEKVENKIKKETKQNESK